MERCSPECAWSLTTAPAIEPFTVQEAKDQIRSVQSLEDGVIDGYIRAARQAAEDYLGRGLLTQTWTLTLSAFVNVIPLPMAAPLQNDPLASPTSTAPVIQYYDTDGVLQTLATTIYDVDTTSRPGRLTLAANQSWPAIQSGRRTGAVQIRYVVGWTAPSEIPDAIRQGMRLLIGYFDADRDGMDPAGEQALRVAKLFWTDRVFWVPPQYESY